MAYTSKNKADVKEAIENNTNDYLDRFIQADVVKQADDAMTANKSAIQVADAVFDYLYTHNQGTAAESAGLKNCMTKDTMYILRQEIISILS